MAERKLIFRFILCGQLQKSVMADWAAYVVLINLFEDARFLACPTFFNTSSRIKCAVQLPVVFVLGGFYVAVGSKRADVLAVAPLIIENLPDFL